MTNKTQEQTDLLVCIKFQVIDVLKGRLTKIDSDMLSIKIHYN